MAAVGGAAAGTGGSTAAVDPYPLPRAPMVDLSKSERWSDPATWGGQLPAAGADVTIPVGKVVLLDVDATVGALQVHGTLACDPQKDESLRASGIMVDGTLACGSQDAPYLHHFDVTLTSPAGAAADLSGIMVMSGGLLELFGDPRRGWTQLAKTAKAGDTTVSVVEPLGFREGDKVVIASTDFDPDQAEEAAITKVAGNTLTLGQPLQWMHFGELQSFENPVAPAVKTLDERAEVGLLTRNIVVQGDAASEKTGLGADVMTMAGGKMYVQGVELVRAGQRGIKGRYPLHWHLAGDATGQFIADTSIHHSYNRCITVHGTNNATVLRNVCFDHIGHGYFLEDGVEVGNVLAYNLGLGTHSAPSDQAILVSDTGASFSMIGQHAGPSTFWLANPDNILVGNHAAGSEGSGYWYPAKQAPTGPSASATDVHPNQLPLRQFSGDVAHSSQIGLVLGFDQDGNYDWYSPKSPSTVDRFTGYKVRGDTGGQSGVVWVRGGDKCVFRDMVTADSRHHYNYAYNALLDGALLVGRSANLGTPKTDEEKKAGRSLPVVETIGVGLYDGPHHFKNAYFTQFDSDPYRSTAAMSEIDGAYNAPDNLAQGMAFDKGSVRFDWGKDAGANVSVLDVDGSLTGHAGWYLTGRNPTMRDQQCVKLQSAPNEAYGCPGRILHLVVKLPANPSVPDSPGTGTFKRSSDAAAQAVVGGFCAGCGSIAFYDNNVLGGYGYQYRFERPEKLPYVVYVELSGTSKAGDWISLELPIQWGNAFVYPADRQESSSGPLISASDDVAALASATSGYAPSSGGLTFKLTIPRDNGKIGMRICRNQGCN